MSWKEMFVALGPPLLLAFALFGLNFWLNRKSLGLRLRAARRRERMWREVASVSMRNENNLIEYVCAVAPPLHQSVDELRQRQALNETHLRIAARLDADEETDA